MRPTKEIRFMLNVYLRSIHCHEETDEAGSDEPYALVTAVNFASHVTVAGFPVPITADDQITPRLLRQQES